MKAPADHGGHASVSVVIATYNMGRFLGQAIDSVLGQTCPPHEIHVVDDGSTDGTPRVMERFAEVPNLRYHRQPNAGQAAAKNRGIRASTGAFVAFVDADDLWTRNKLEIQLAAFREHPEVGVVHTNFAYMDEEGRLLESPKRRYYDGWIAGRLLVDNFVNGMSSVVRRQCLDDVGLFDESLPMGIDYDLWLRISAKYPFLFVDEVTYLYRQWAGQMSHNYRKRLECAITIMERFIRQNPGLVDARTIHEAWAHTLVSRGRCLAYYERNKWGALVAFARALTHRPSYLLAWKAIARLALRRPGAAGKPAST